MLIWRVDAAACILGALMLLTLPLNWLLAAVTAAVIHELCHFLVLRVLGGNVTGVSISTRGVVMEIAPLSRKKELICALAGPAGSLFLLSMYRLIPRISFCAGVQAMYNLLPIFPLDGGRVLRCAVGSVLTEDKTDNVCHWTERTVVLVVLLFSAFGAFAWNLGFMPLLAAIMWIIKKKTLQTGASRGTIVLPYTKR